jgi:hypothetical protein
VVLACAKFVIVLRKVKLFGTSTNLFKLEYKKKKNVKKIIFPPFKKNATIAQKMAKCIILPKNIYLFIFNLIISVCLLYVLFIMPYTIAFEIENKTKELLEDFMNYLFILDLVLMFFTALYDSEE